MPAKLSYRPATIEAICSKSPFFFSIAFVVLLFTVVASAQTEGSTRTDSSTPIGLSPGSPTGSYPLSDFETINPFNGGLNFRLPLLTIGGRGGTSYSLPLHIEQKWSISRQVNPHQPASYTAHSGWWSEDLDIVRLLNVGRLQVRRGGSENFVNCNGEALYTKTLTRITFTAPDGTEYELRDQLTGGQPATPTLSPCQASGFNRQKIFVTADGTSATYISDSNIIDANYFNEAGDDPERNSGEMMLRDGTHFHIVDGDVRWMRDRNGNMVTFDYDLGFKRLVGITDSLNRHVTIVYGNSSTSTTYYDEIDFSGYGGSARTVRIGHCLRSDAMRGDLTAPSPLFSGVTVENNNPTVINYIELPDGRRYRIQYNGYAEIARIELPTGGAIEYEWDKGLTDGAGSGQFDSVPARDKYVYRRVVERRVYPDGGTGSGYESKMTYSRPESSTTNAGYVVVDQYNASSLLLGRTQHYFNGSARASFLQKGTDYPAWADGREYKTEIFDTHVPTNTPEPTLLRRVENIFEQRASVSWWTLGTATEPGNDVRLKETITTLADTNQVSKQSFGYDDSVPFNNRNSVKEYDFGNGGPGALLRETRTTYLNDSSYTGTSVHIRQLATQVTILQDASEIARTKIEYDNYTQEGSDCEHSFHCLPMARANITGFDSSFGTGYVTRGNATASIGYLVTNGVVPDCNVSPSQCVTSYAQFDVAGNVVRSIDARSTLASIIATTVDYDDRFGTPDSDARGNSLPPELSGGLKTFALPTKVTNALGHAAYSQYDYYLGRPVNTEDANGMVTSASYDDLLERPKLVKQAINTLSETHTTFDYDDIGRVITTTGDLDTDGRQLISKLLYDQMGRTIETRRYEGGGNYIVVQTQYDVLGRANNISNPFRPLSETAIWTTSEFDALGRLKKVTTPDGATVETSYVGNSVEVKDQALKTRRSITDGLGRLTSVYEAPNDSSYNYLTSYAYDALDNLISVTQGSQTRTFVYDSLKRLKSATNPESGTTCYGTVNVGGLCQADGYDANGNLKYRTDARGVLATYTYDALNRNIFVDYSNTTANPDITRVYDNATNGANGKGRFWYSYADSTDSLGMSVEQTAIDGYDPLGRPRIQRQLFRTGSSWSSPYQTERTYDLAGHVKTQLYPSGHTVTYNYDGAGRLGDKDPSNPAFTGNLGEGGAALTYATGITYSSVGTTAKEKFGTDTAIYNKMFYNSRGQLGEIRAGTVDTTGDTSWNRGKFVNWYSLQCGGSNCNATDNNGNLRKQEIWVPNNEQNTSNTSWYQQYEYDTLNRLSEVHEHNVNNTLLWHQSFAYDRYGNRTIVANGTSDGINKLNFEVEAATNRLLATGDSALTGSGLPLRKMRYDDAGNLTNDSWSSYGSSTQSAITRTFDAENRMTSAWDNTGGISTYHYNADGQRVRRKSGSAEIWQVYGMDGELLAEYSANGPIASPQKEYGYRNGQLLITAEPGAGSVAPVFSDDFNDNSLDTIKWTVDSAQGTPPVTEQSQQLQISLAPSTAGYNGVLSSSAYNLTGRMVQLEVAQAVSQAGWAENFFAVELDPQNGFLIDVGATSIIFRSRVNGVNDQAVLTYDASAHRHWRIRHDQTANTINFETSADAAVWTIRKRVTPGFSLTSLRFHLGAGAWGTGNGSPGAAKYDNFKLMASAQASSSLTVPNSGFEAPSVGATGFQYGPAGGSWTFSGAGVTGNNSGFTGGIAAPEGSQAAFLQGGNLSIISQTVSGFQSGTNYIVTFAAAQRLNCCNAGGQDFQVYLDNTLLGTFHPSTAGYSDYSTATFTTTGGAHELKFVGLNLLGGDHTAFIDNVRIQGSPIPGLGVEWLVTDQLGTPRLVFDKTGALATTKRHDYLPFGEEIGGPQVALLGGRTMSMGYNAVDNVRQKFTQKERDNETGLDYFGARYYSSIQGRFVSPDPLLASGSVFGPQSWNRYSYTGNNPLRFVDPTGLWNWAASAGGSDSDDDLLAKASDKSLKKKERQAAQRAYDFRQRFKAALGRVESALNNSNLTTDQRAQVLAAVGAYGQMGVDGAGDNNGVVVGQKDLSRTGNAAQTLLCKTGVITVDFQRGKEGDGLALDVAHEGQHVADDDSWLASGREVGGSTDLTHRDTEIAAYTTESLAAQAMGFRGSLVRGEQRKTYQIWNSGWKAADRETYRTRGVINTVTTRYESVLNNRFSDDFKTTPACP